MNPRAADPITTAVLQSRLAAIAEEMGEAMLRTSYSQILNSSRDFSIALVDAAGRLVAQADHIPVHVGAMAPAARAVAAAFPDAVAGDVFLLNDPYHGGSHLPDVTAFVPVFTETRLVFWSVVRGHQSDIGGATHGGYNPAATEIWQEGLRIPPIRLTERGVVRADLVAMLAANTRNARDFRGDLAAMVGAARLGEARLLAVLAEFGPAVLQGAVDAMLDAAERHARAVVATWRPGVYRGVAVLDDDGHGATDIHIRATVTVEGASVTVDLSDSDAQVTGFVNSSWANMVSAVTMAFAYLLDPDTARNDGAFRALRVLAREGTVVWAREGAPVTLCTSHCSNEIVEAVIDALQGACPDRVMGGWGRRFRVALAGTDPRTGRGFIWHLFHARPGGGASPGGDGWAAAGEWHSVGGIKFGSVEVTEARFPLLLEHHEFRAGSGGAGAAPRRGRGDVAPGGGDDGPGAGQHGGRRGAARRARHAGRGGRAAAPHHADGAGRGRADAADQGERRAGAARERAAGGIGRRRGVGRVTYAVGVDVGGTFTDVVVAGPHGTLVAKAATTPEDQSEGVLAGLADAAGQLGLTLPALLAATGRVVHGTTVATNALLEGKGARVGMLVTEGHRDVLEMREGLKPDRYDLRMPPPADIVPRALRLGVRERLRWDGSVAVPLDRGEPGGGARCAGGGGGGVRGRVLPARLVQSGA